MGQSFIVTVTAPSAAEAFDRAKADYSPYDSRGRWIGGIAEKQSFKFFTPLGGEDMMECAQRHLDEGTFEGEIDSPAGCVKGPPGTYLFFGWSS